MNNNVFFVTVMVGFGLALAAYGGSHVNISVEKINLATELCKTNDGLEYVDWSNVGCINGAEFEIYRYLNK